MRKLVALVVVVAVGLLLRTHFQQKQEREAEARIAAERREYASRVEDLQPEREAPRRVAEETREESYSCDGRKRCSQMHSCEEATWFIENCPGMEMDGDDDGVPCERQWCGHLLSR